MQLKNKHRTHSRGWVSNQKLLRTCGVNPQRVAAIPRFRVLHRSLQAADYNSRATRSEPTAVKHEAEITDKRGWIVDTFVSHITLSILTQPLDNSPRSFLLSAKITATMYFSPPPVEIPSSYESFPTRHIKVSHYPVGSSTATPVVIVTLNRPEKRNAFTMDMAEDLEKVFNLFDRDERVRAIVLTGAGNTFCAGADLEIGFRALEPRARDHRDRFVLARSHEMIISKKID